MKEASDTLLRAVILALLLSSFVVAPFRIPTPSMEPALLGDADHGPLPTCPFSEYHQYLIGDRVLVSKFEHALTPIRRFDVIVFRFPLDISKSFIKRVIGLPGERVLIEQGNIFVQAPGETEFRIARKPPAIQDSIWIRHSGPYADPAEFQKEWQTRGDLQINPRSIECSSSGDVQLSYRHPIKDRDALYARWVSDIRLSMQLTPGPQGECITRIVNAYGTFEVKIVPGEAYLVVDGKASKIMALTDREIRLECMFLDGQYLVRIDGRVVAEHTCVETYKDLKPGYFSEYSEDVLSRKMRLVIKDLRVDRDLYFKRRDGDPNLREGEPMDPLPPDCYFVLGDNASVSKDARSWRKKTFHLKNGETVVCERDAVDTGVGKYQDHYDRPLALVVKNDQYGAQVPIFEEDLVGEPDDEAFPYVPERYIVGKALWIWWPPTRWFRAIR
jgi:signal peptidase I